MKFFHMEYFLATCRSGSISKASEILLVSRPAVSKALRELEAEYGVSLLSRTPAGISLTEAGIAFLDKCEKIESMLEELRSEMYAKRAATTAAEQRHIRIGLSPAAAHSIFPKYYHDFIRRNPDVVVEVQEIYVKSAVQMLMEDKVDACLEVHVLPDHGFDQDMLGFIEFGNMDLMFFCNKSHRLANHESISLEDIRDEKLICFQKPALHKVFANYDWTPNYAFNTSQISVLQQMVESGICSAIQFSGYVEHTESLVAIPFKETFSYPIWLVWNKTQKHNSAFNDLIDFAYDVHAKLGSRSKL